MADYIVEIEGKWPLPQIELQILTEERGSTNFVESHVSLYRGSLTNLASFTVVTPIVVPKPIHLVEGAPGVNQPANTSHVWTGTMLVTGAAKLISVYREN